jgi:hypothetical protein
MIAQLAKRFPDLMEHKRYYRDHKDLPLYTILNH